MRGNLKTEWGRLTENDRRLIDGKFDQMIGLVQERYGYTKEGASKVLTHYLGDYGKHRHNRAAKPTKMWGPALAVVGLFSLTAMGWFFFSRFLTETPKMSEEKVAEADFVASPEMDLV
jgi:uncharacterized protein YjbJ (UPF0337 family)